MIVVIIVFIVFFCFVAALYWLTKRKTRCTSSLDENLISNEPAELQAFEHFRRSCKRHGLCWHRDKTCVSSANSIQGV